jgi:hypothetical protein
VLLRSLVGRQEEAFRASEEACRAAEAAGDLATLCWDLGNVAGIYLNRGEFAATQVYFERALEVAQRQGTPLQIVAMTHSLAVLTFYNGH